MLGALPWSISVGWVMANPNGHQNVLGRGRGRVATPNTSGSHFPGQYCGAIMLIEKHHIESCTVFFFNFAF